MGPYELGVANTLWQKAFTLEWGATRRQAGAKVKRSVSYSALGQVWCMLLIHFIRHASTMPTVTFWFKVFLRMANIRDNL